MNSWLYQLRDNLEMVKTGEAWHYKKYQREQSKDDQLSYEVAENNTRLHGIVRLTVAIFTHPFTAINRISLPCHSVWESRTG